MEVRIATTVVDMRGGLQAANKPKTTTVASKTRHGLHVTAASLTFFEQEQTWQDLCSAEGGESAHGNAPG